MEGEPNQENPKEILAEAKRKLVLELKTTLSNPNNPLIIEAIEGEYGRMCEAVAILTMNEKEARLERLREVAHVWHLLGYFEKSLVLIEQVAEIAQNEGDTESYEEALETIEKIKGKIMEKSEAQVKRTQQLAENARLAAEVSDEERRSNFEKTMEEVNAGNHDPEYLKEVLDWLIQDADNTEKDIDSPERVTLRHDMAEAIVRIRNLIAESK